MGGVRGWAEEGEEPEGGILLFDLSLFPACLLYGNSLDGGVEPVRTCFTCHPNLSPTCHPHPLTCHPQHPSARRAVDIQAELMKLGQHVRDTYIGTATQDAQTIEEFLQSATDFYLLNRGVVSEYQFANSALAEYVELLKKEVANLKQELEMKEVATNIMLEMMSNG